MKTNIKIVHRTAYSLALLYRSLLSASNHSSIPPYEYNLTIIIAEKRIILNSPFLVNWHLPYQCYSCSWYPPLRRPRDPITTTRNLTFPSTIKFIDNPHWRKESKIPRYWMRRLLWSVHFVMTGVDPLNFSCCSDEGPCRLGPGRRCATAIYV